LIRALPTHFSNTVIVIAEIAIKLIAPTHFSNIVIIVGKGTKQREEKDTMMARFKEARNIHDGCVAQKLTQKLQKTKKTLYNTIKLPLLRE